VRCLVVISVNEVQFVKRKVKGKAQIKVKRTKYTDTHNNGLIEN